MTDATPLLAPNDLQDEFINMNVLYKVPQWANLIFSQLFCLLQFSTYTSRSRSGLIVYPNHSDIVILLCWLVPTGVVPLVLLTFQITLSPMILTCVIYHPISQTPLKKG